MTDEKPKQPWTQGPWRSDYDEVDAFSDIYAVGRGDNGCSLHIVDVCGPNSYSNGKLMAAAPAMAEALALVVSRYDTRTTDDMCRGPGERKDPTEIAAARAALDLCGWQWGGR
jgi:hypothetical protein